MVGRAAYKTPYFMADIDRLIFGAGEAPLSRDEIVERLIPYAENWSRKIYPCMPSPALDGAVSGLPGGLLWRRYLSENAVGANVPATVLQGAWMWCGPNANAPLWHRNGHAFDTDRVFC
ncbi:MAG: hypothetical protein CM15mP21_1480 [Hyphomicrobiales bacterium]|nr:MAG: hypothetical protein CM15mP21_1480 [Hyphomicrobiales bacterium]